jgi:hypothetical protein
MVSNCERRAGTTRRAVEEGQDEPSS